MASLWGRSLWKRALSPLDGFLANLAPLSPFWFLFVAAIRDKTLR